MSDNLESITNFDQMNLKPKLLEGIFAAGFERPSAIQQKAIMPIISGKDVICQAQSGTGKTATFAIGSIQRVDETLMQPQVLVISPTRELALQSNVVISTIGRPSGIKTVSLTGGSSVQDDNERLKSGVHHVCGTIGRIEHLIRSNQLRLEHMKMVIVDEADEMLSSDFAEKLAAVFSWIPKGVQIVLVSATMPKEILDLTENFMTNPVKILVKEDEITLEGIRQYYVQVQDEWKVPTLLDIYKVLSVSQSVIFCNTTGRVNQLAEALTAQNFTCSIINGNMEQSERNEVMKSFKAGDARVLIATNLIARGIDVQNVTLVLNFDIPKNCETYLHRIGRSGRFGRKGIAINFVNDKDVEQLQRIQTHFSIKIDELPKDLASLI